MDLWHFPTTSVPKFISCAANIDSGMIYLFVYNIYRLTHIKPTLCRYSNISPIGRWELGHDHVSATGFTLKHKMAVDI